MLLPLLNNLASPGDTELLTSTATVSEGFGATHTTAFGINPPANSRLVAVARAGRSNHTTAFAWSFTASGGLGAMTVAWSGAEWPAAGNNFARQMAIAYVDVGPSPPTGVTVTVDAWATADTGSYGVALLCVTDFNAGAWLAQTPGEDYKTTGATFVAPALAAASTGQTIAVAFAEDSGIITTWRPLEAGWDWVAHTVTGYYIGNVIEAAGGDASGSTTITFSPTSNNTAQGVIFEIAPGVTAVAGSATGTVPVVARITGTKVAASSARAAVPVVARPALAKIASTAAVRAPVPAVARSTGAKIAVGATSAAAPVVARITGTAVSTAVQGAMRALATVTAQITGTKIAGGSTRGAIPAVSRATGTKIAGGSTRATVAPVGRFTTTKVATSSALAALAMAARASATKIAGGATRATVTATGQASASKSTATGAARATVPVVARPTLAKIATGGAVSTTAAVVARITGQVPGGLSVRAGIAVVARITGTKTTTAGGARAAVPAATARATGSKSTAAGAVRAVVAPVVRATASKAATGAATVLVPAVARVTTTKLGRGSTVAPVTATARASATKLGQGSMRGALAVIVRTPSRAPVEAWSWFIRRGASWLQSSPKLDGVHPTSTDVT